MQTASRIGHGHSERRRIEPGRLALGIFFIAAGAAHFALTRFYVLAVPAYLPAPRALILVSGAAELAGGVGVLLPQTRRAAAWGLVTLLVAVFPANLWMAQHPDVFPGIPHWAFWLRLPLQVPLIWWAWLYTRRAPF